MKLSKASKITLSWAVITFGSLYAFYLSRNDIQGKRYEHMKIRERMKQSNSGEYEPSTRKYANN